MVDPRTTDNGADGVIVPNSVLEPLEDHHANALSASIPISPSIKGEALAVGAKEIEGCHGHDSIRGENHAGACGQRERTLAATEALRRQMNRHQASAATGIEGHAGAMEVVVVGDAVGHDGDAVAGGRILRLPVRVPQAYLLIVYQWLGLGPFSFSSLCLLFFFNTDL